MIRIYVQLLHDESNHCFLTFCSNGKVQVCDSLRSKSTPGSRKSIRSLYKHYVPGGQRITFLPVSSQFDVNKMRCHLIVCSEQQNLSSFPKVLSD